MSIIRFYILTIILIFPLMGFIATDSIIEQSNIKSQVTQIQKYEFASNAFQIQYQSLPGDINNATEFWQTTTNGNGDGKVGDTVDHAFQNNDEGLTFFNHISIAGMVDNYFNGRWIIGVGYPRLLINSQKGMSAGSKLTNLPHNSY